MLLPGEFTAAGPLVIGGNDGYQFDTNANTLTDTTTNTVIYAGTSGDVFDFSSIAISGGTFTVTGTAPLVLLSQSNLTMSGESSA